MIQHHSAPLATAASRSGAHDGIPVLRPLLPRAERLLPYLRRIDETRIYSNHGPLSGELERRLAELSRDREVVAYCRGPYCVYSDEAAELLQRNGFRVRRLNEGFPECLVILNVN